MTAVIGPAVAPHVAARVGAYAKGDDQVREVAATLTPEQARGGSALPDPLPTVAGDYVNELDRLRVAERRVLVFAALSVTRLAVDVLDAAAIDPDVLLFGRLNLLIAIENGRVAFRDERVRSHVLNEIGGAERRETHAALARCARRRGNPGAAIWHGAHAAPVGEERAARTLLATADDHLRDAHITEARVLALAAVAAAPDDMIHRAWATAGLAAFWAGELDDAAGWLLRAQQGRDETTAHEAGSAMLVTRALTEHPAGSLFTHDEADRIFRAMVDAARSPVDRAALTQLGAVADAVYGRPEEADSLLARLFLSLGVPAKAGLTPHAEAQVTLMQVAFQSQSGDRAGAARLLADAVPRLPLVLPAAGVVSSYVKILAAHDHRFDATLIAAYEAIGPAQPLRYDGDGAVLGHGPEIGRRASAATQLSMPDVPFSATVALSRRQLQVLHLVEEGRSNKQIAQALGISHRTVEVHVGEILRKFEVNTRTELLSLRTVRQRRADTYEISLNGHATSDDHSRSRSASPLR